MDEILLHNPDSEKTLFFNARQYFGDYHRLEPFMEMKNGYEDYWQWPGDFNNGYFYLMKLKPGLILTIIDHYSSQPVAIETGVDGDRFVMSFILPSPGREFYSVFNGVQKHPAVFAPSQAYLTYIPDFFGQVRLPEKTRFHCIGIAMKPWVVEEFWTGSGEKIPDQLNNVLQAPRSQHNYHQQLTFTPLINLRLHEILGCRFQGNRRRYYLESKVLELLVLGFEQLQCSGQTHQGRFPSGRNNHNEVLQAREILLGNMTSPPSLAELSRKVGMNKTTLNQSFRKTYGVSVFEYLRICRLEKSRDLLQSGTMSVTDVALEVGYSQQSSFTTEFTKYFGENPKCFLQ